MFEIRIEMVTTEYVKRQIVIYKETKKKVTKFVNKGDIRKYLL